MAAAAQIDKPESIPTSGGAVAFVYGDAAFLEAGRGAQAAAHFEWRGHRYTLPAHSASIVRPSTGDVLFNSHIGSAPPAHARAIVPVGPPGSGGGLGGEWGRWAEPITAPPAGSYPPSALRRASAPIEMTNLTRGLTTFAFYSTTFGPAALPATLRVPTYEAMGLVAFADGTAIGHAENYAHHNGAPINLSIPLATPTIDSLTDVEAGRAAPANGTHTLTLLGEELGYANYGFNTPIAKGLAAPGVLDVPVSGGWSMRAGLAGEHLGLMGADGASKVAWERVKLGTRQPAASWYQTSFATPDAVLASGGGAQLLLNATGLHRGRFWVNGHDAGRYWLLPRNDPSACAGGEPSCATQTLYHIPTSWLTAKGSQANRLVLFEVEGEADVRTVGLAISSMRSEPPVHTDLSKVVSCVF